MNKISIYLLSLPLLTAMAFPVMAQDNTPKADEREKYVFTTEKMVSITPVKDQANSGTCWSFSGLGFFESEALRNSGIKVDLSPMYIVAQSYKDKARDYVRYQGNLNFAQGGSFNDVLVVIREHGIIPLSEMSGLNYGTKRHSHSELESVAGGFLKALVKEMGEANRLTTAWGTAFDGIIDAYLGKAPTEFVYEGKKYTPKSFAKALKINPDDYVSITSYTHHPFYSSFILEIPDNWRHGSSYNVPFEEMMQIIDNAVNNDYAVAWGTDVSEPGFTRNGLALLVDMESKSSHGSDQERWVGASPSERKNILKSMLGKIGMPEVEVTQQYRQESFENLSLTDDHGMVIYGIAKDQTGKKFYIVKNSWGSSGDYEGVWYASEQFVAGRTMNIVVNKNAIPKAIRAKLGI